MNKRQLELMGLLLEMTRAGRAVWRADSSNAFQTKVAG
jgi:hypothetical protein